ncbi:MAG TPA: ABC transporter permease [Bryobacteraceae bacterium]
MSWGETTWQDVRYGFRGLGRNPGFAVTAALSLTLGVGASVAIFTVADHMLLRPLPYRDASKLTMVWERNYKRNHGRNVISPGNYFDWKSQNDVFEGMAALRDTRSVLADGARVEEFGKQSVSAEFFPLLGVRAYRGRLFTAEEDRPPDSVLLISHRLWQSWFGGDETAIGRRVQINSLPRTIIGVLPPGFHFLNRDVDLWEPLGLNPAQDYRATSGRWMMSVARLKPGVSPDVAQAHMTELGRRIEAANPQFDTGWTIQVEPLRETLVHEVKTSLLVLLGAVGLLLGVACANVANLLLARYTAREREMAVRVSLGAGRARLIRQLLTESLILGIAGGVCGILAARWAIRGLLAVAPRDLASTATISIDGRILLFALVLAVATGVIFGLAPALVTARAGLANALRGAGRSSIGGGLRLRSWLVGGEVALSVMLLAGGLLLFRSLTGLQGVNAGIDPSNLLTFRVSVPAARYRDLSKRVQFYDRAADGLRHLPGVKSAAAISYLPFAGLAAGTWLNIEGRLTARPGEELSTVVRTVTPGYFQAMGIPLKQGRDFTAADNDVKTPHRFIVNEAFVRKHLRGENPLAARISVLMDDTNPYGDIIGVVGDVKEGSLDKDPEPTAYYVHAHLTYASMVFVVRTDRNPKWLAEPARRVILGVDALQPISEVRTMEEVLGETYSRQRFSTLLLAGFSAASLLLAAIGIYGVLAYAVTERTREIGVRVALGAEPSRIVGLVVGSGARLVAVGVAAGLAGALALSGLLWSMLFGVGPRDAMTFALAPAILAAVALMAAYIPARRAARLSPMDALRSE